MQEGDGPVASLRELAGRCRMLAASMTHPTAAVSLRKIAVQYDEAADAAEERNRFHWKRPPVG